MCNLFEKSAQQMLISLCNMIENEPLLKNMVQLITYFKNNLNEYIYLSNFLNRITFVIMETLELENTFLRY